MNSERTREPGSPRLPPESFAPVRQWYPMRQAGAVLVTLLIGAAISTVLFRVMQWREQSVIQAQFQVDAGQRIASIESAMQVYLGAARAAGAFYHSSQEVDRSEFAVFTANLRSDLPHIRSFQWAPRVKDADRGAHEQAGREQIRADYHITQRQDEELLVPAERRDEYYPIFFKEPGDPTSATFGFDVLSDRDRHDAVYNAIARGQPVLSPRARMVQGADGMHDAVIIVVPVFQHGELVGTLEQRLAAIRGCILVVLPLHNIIDESLAQVELSGMTTSIRDVTGPGAGQLLYSNDSPDGQSSLDRDVFFPTRVGIVDRTWLIECRPTPAYLAARRTLEPQLTLIAGLVITVLAAGLIFILVGRASQIAHLVEQRTAERDSFFMLSPDLMCVAGFNGYFKRLNPSWAQTLGFTTEELTSRPYIELIHPEDRGPTINMAGEIAEGQTIIRFENRYVCKDGSYRTLVWSAAPMPREQLIFAVARDVTDQKQAQEALRESEHRFEQMANHAPVMIWMADADSQFTFCNESWLRFTGRSMPQERGEGWLLGVHADDRAARREVVRDATFRHEYRLRRADGQYRWVLDTGVPRHDADGKLLGFIGSCIDITDLKQIRDELENRVRERTAVITETNLRLEEEILQRRQINQRIVVHQRNLRTLAAELALAEERERQRIATGLHDEIGQELALLKIHFRSLQSTLPSQFGDPAREIQSLLEQVIHGVRSLTFEFGSPTLYRFGIEAAIEQLCEQLHQEHGIQAAFHNDDQPVALSDALRITLFQGVRELIHNIVKHAQARHVDVAVALDSDQIVIDVTDDGVGFDPDQLNPESRNMTGFGLFSIRERLEYLGGTMEITAAPGKGTRVTLRAPINPSPDSPEA